jgi:hypothetical protein
VGDCKLANGASQAFPGHFQLPLELNNPQGTGCRLGSIDDAILGFAGRNHATTPCRHASVWLRSGLPGLARALSCHILAFSGPGFHQKRVRANATLSQLLREHD